MTSVGVVIGTYGDRALWKPFVERALRSLEAQTLKPDDYMWVHAETLQEARNTGAELMGDNEYLIFLDADDELDPGYVVAMVTAAAWTPRALHTIYRPATIGKYPDGTTDAEAVMIPRRDLKVANFIVIGAMCPSQLFFQVGGFDSYPILEDWALWRAMVAAGAQVVDVPDAVYQVNVRPHSRNTDHPLHGQIYSRIQREVPL